MRIVREDDLSQLVTGVASQEADVVGFVRAFENLN